MTELLKVTEKRFSVSHYTGPIEVILESHAGAFVLSFKIVAFGGEVMAWVHFTGGHYVHWHVVVQCAYAAIESFSSERYKKGTTKQEAFEALDKHLSEQRRAPSQMGDKEVHWWDEAREEVMKLILG